MKGIKVMRFIRGHRRKADRQMLLQISDEVNKSLACIDRKERAKETGTIADLRKKREEKNRRLEQFADYMVFAARNHILDTPGVRAEIRSFIEQYVMPCWGTRTWIDSLDDPGMAEIEGWQVIFTECRTGRLERNIMREMVEKRNTWGKYITPGVHIRYIFRTEFWAGIRRYRDTMMPSRVRF